jgi:hypothetical protein
VLLSAADTGTVEIMRRTGQSKPTVWRWQQRFMEEGVTGLLRDKTRPPGKPGGGGNQPGADQDRDGKPTRRDTLECAKRSASAHAASSGSGPGLKPHLVETFKVSNDPRFAEKLVDIVGLYLDPPDRALVLAVDEKSQIQALDRTQPGLPLKKGRAGTMTTSAPAPPRCSPRSTCWTAP